MDVARFFKHLFAPHWIVNRAFPGSALDAIEAAIDASEKTHDGEVRFAVEAALHPLHLWRGQTARQRAQELFAHLNVWDTAHNSGVLIYIQLVDRRIEIVADRGISAKVAQAEWDAICRRLEDAFKAGCFEAGALTGVSEISALLAGHFPPLGENPDELPNRPVLL
jgi:uncharacterized membrane protein